MDIIYTKEGMRIIHSTGVNQLLTLKGLNRLWEKAKEREKKAEEYASSVHDDVNRIEALQ